MCTSPQWAQRMPYAVLHVPCTEVTPSPMPHTYGPRCRSLGSLVWGNPRIHGSRDLVRYHRIALVGVTPSRAVASSLTSVPLVRGLTLEHSRRSGSLCLSLLHAHCPHTRSPGILDISWISWITDPTSPDIVIPRILGSCISPSHRSHSRHIPECCTTRMLYYAMGVYLHAAALHPWSSCGLYGSP